MSASSPSTQLTGLVTRRPIKHLQEDTRRSQSRGDKTNANFLLPFIYVPHGGLQLHALRRTGANAPMPMYFVFVTHMPDQGLQLSVCYGGRGSLASRMRDSAASALLENRGDGDGASSSTPMTPCSSCTRFGFRIKIQFRDDELQAAF